VVAVVETSMAPSATLAAAVAQVAVAVSPRMVALVPRGKVALAATVILAHHTAVVAVVEPALLGRTQRPLLAVTVAQEQHYLFLVHP
jgi:hypothetical protein